jgi:hypothetical protein
MERTLRETKEAKMADCSATGTTAMTSTTAITTISRFIDEYSNGGVASAFSALSSSSSSSSSLLPPRLQLASNIDRLRDFPFAVSCQLYVRVLTLPCKPRSALHAWKQQLVPQIVACLRESK